MIEQGSPEWFECRRGKVTASRVADIIAKTKTGPSTSRQNYLIELALQHATGNIEPSYTNEAMQWGIDNEAQARVAYEVESGSFVDQVGFIDHPTIANFGASPDGLVGGVGLVEIKCPNSATHWSYIKAGKPPQKYITQMQTQLCVTGREWCDFVSFDPRMPEKNQLFVVRVNRDPDYIKMIEQEVEAFNAEVLKEVISMKGSS